MKVVLSLRKKEAGSFDPADSEEVHVSGKQAPGIGVEEKREVYDPP